MENNIIGIERSPFNRVYFLKLVCGHTVTRKRRPISDFTKCEDCKLIAAQKAAEAGQNGLTTGQAQNAADAVENKL
jgi:hypothetical protein